MGDLVFLFLLFRKSFVAGDILKIVSVTFACIYPLVYWLKFCRSLQAGVGHLQCSPYPSMAVLKIDSNWTFIALDLPIQEDSKAQQNRKSSRPNFSIQRQKRGQAPGDDPV